MEEKERYDVKRLSYSLNVKLTDNYEPDWRYIIFDDVNDAELDKLETVCNLLNQQDKELSKLQASYQQVKEENQQLKQQLAENEVKIANLEVLLSENAIDRKAMQEFKIGEDEYDLTDEDARNSLCWEVEELRQQLLTFANRISDQNEEILKLHDLPKNIVEDFYDEIRHRAILEDDYCPDRNFERKYGVRKCLLENIKDTILKKYGGEDEN